MTWAYKLAKGVLADFDFDRSAGLEPLSPVSIRPGEGVADVAARLEAVRKLRSEPQLNREAP